MRIIRKSNILGLTLNSLKRISKSIIRETEKLRAWLKTRYSEFNLTNGTIARTNKNHSAELRIDKERLEKRFTVLIFSPFFIKKKGKGKENKIRISFKFLSSIFFSFFTLSSLSKACRREVEMQAKIERMKSLKLQYALLTRSFVQNFKVELA